MTVGARVTDRIPVISIRESVTGTRPRLCTVTCAGMESANASSSRAAVTLMATPAASSSARRARASMRSTAASRSRSAGGQASGIASGARKLRRGMSVQRGAASRTASSARTALASESTARCGRRRSSARCAASAAATAWTMAARVEARSAPSRATVVSIPSKIERSSVAGVPAFTRVSSRVRRDIVTPRRSSPPCPCDRCIERLAAASSAGLRPSTGSYAPTSKVSVAGSARAHAPR